MGNTKDTHNDTSSDARAGTLPRRRLGRLNREVTIVGLGGAALTEELYGRTHTEEESFDCVRRALELGVRYIDTSPLYGSGESERRLGIALANAPVSRSEIFLATKTGTQTKPHDYSADGTRRSVETSLRRLQTDRLDLVQIHDPEDAAAFETALGPNGALEALIGLKEQGVIGGIGLGVRSHAYLRRAIEHGAFDTILTYADFNLLEQSARDDLFAVAQTRDVGIVLGSPVLFGYLTERPVEEVAQEVPRPAHDVEAARHAHDFAHRMNVPLPVLNAQYILRDGRVSTILFGAGSASEIEEDVASVTAPPLPASVWDALANEQGIG